MPLLGLRDRFDTCTPTHIHWEVLCLSPPPPPFNVVLQVGIETLAIDDIGRGSGVKNYHGGSSGEVSQLFMFEIVANLYLKKHTKRYYIAHQRDIAMK